MTLTSLSSPVINDGKCFYKKKWQIKKPIHVCRKRFSQAILKDRSSLKDYLTAKARLSHPHIKNWPYENPSRTMKTERKQNVIIVCNKDKDAHPRKMFNVQKYSSSSPEKITHRLSFRQRWVNFHFQRHNNRKQKKINRKRSFSLALRDVLASFRVSLIKRKFCENLEEDANLG